MDMGSQEWKCMHSDRARKLPVSSGVVCHSKRQPPQHLGCIAASRQKDKHVRYILFLALSHLVGTFHDTLRHWLTSKEHRALFNTQLCDVGAAARCNSKVGPVWSLVHIMQVVKDSELWLVGVCNVTKQPDLQNTCWYCTFLHTTDI